MIFTKPKFNVNFLKSPTVGNKESSFLVACPYSWDRGGRRETISFQIDITGACGAIVLMRYAWDHQ